MTFYDIIAKKRDNLELTKEEIEFFINGVITKKIPDYQIAALLMAIRLNGLKNEELFNLTDFMAKSGDMVDLTDISKPTCDKHSTGGVGDKTTFIVAPILAAAGIVTAKMSGRGLGFTGGTIDKLESIEGFKTDLSFKDFKNILLENNFSITSTSGNIALADKYLYQLRDVTATVDSVPLIASSVMSKKLAAGSKNIVLDVKCGSGAFMKTKKDAIRLAKLMVKIGKNAGRNVTALITDMSCPLGESVGNSLEINEALNILEGKTFNGFTTLCLSLAASGIQISLNMPYKKAYNFAKELLISGKAKDCFLNMVKKQGGNINNIKNAKNSYNIYAKTSGYISKIDAEEVGKTAIILGAGRLLKEDKIDYGAGILFNKTKGDYVLKGEILATLYSDNSDSFKTAEEMLLNSILVTKFKPKKAKIIIKRID